MKSLRRVLVAALLIVTTIGLGFNIASAGPGNGAESGSHYNLNIIGTSDKNPDMTGDNGHRIFVALNGATKIKLSPGEFGVLDANGTDGEAAFQLPNPASNSYTVYIRPLGTPGGSAHMMTCAEAFNLVDYKITGKNRSSFSEDDICSLDTVGTDILTRTKGRKQFVDVTDELTSLTVEVENIETGETMLLTVPLFDDAFSGYFWDYNNDGLRIAQLRFYPN